VKKQGRNESDGIKPEATGVLFYFILERKWFPPQPQRCCSFDGDEKIENN
jgi:hypothetical protein